MNLKILITVLILLCESSWAFDHDYGLWAKLLTSFGSTVENQTYYDYQAQKADQKALDLFIRELESITRAEYEDFSKNQKLSFLINSYNVYTIKLIVVHYPIKSIKDIGTFFTSPWKRRDFMLFKKKVSLDDIEHKMLRVWFKEPRIHFAVVCASLSCPNLALRPYTEKGLNSLLDEQARAFIGDPAKNSLEKNNLRLSNLFKWYGSDFENYLKYVATRITRDKALQRKISTGKIRRLWKTYDWNLNERTKK